MRTTLSRIIIAGVIAYPCLAMQPTRHLALAPTVADARTDCEDWVKYGSLTGGLEYYFKRCVYGRETKMWVKFRNSSRNTVSFSWNVGTGSMVGLTPSNCRYYEEGVWSSSYAELEPGEESDADFGFPKSGTNWACVYNVKVR